MKNNVIYGLVIIAFVFVVIFLIQPSKKSGMQTPNTSTTQIEVVKINDTPVNTENNASPSVQIVPAKQYDVSIVNFAFSPNTLTINKGDTVVWTNNDSMQHRIIGGGLNSPILNKGTTYSFTFNTAGTFDYICSIHPSMKAKIIVQ